jgi:serine/threonine-protein kinase
VFGTLNYMSPEQANGLVGEIDARTDIFALGAIAYEMLAGRRAFDAPITSGILYQVCHGEPAPLPSFRSDLPADIAIVLGQAMAKARDERFTSISAFAEAFGAACGRPARSMGTQPPPPSAPRAPVAPTTFSGAADNPVDPHGRQRGNHESTARTVTPRRAS